jgi:FeS assembly protein IscX
MKWLDVYDIAIALEEAHPTCAILSLRFTDLKQMIVDLPEFQDDASRSNEKTLEAIQMAWLSERD